MKELKPCPFCGSKNVSCMEEAIGYSLNIFQFVVCKSCGARTILSRSEQIVIERWNRRADENKRNQQQRMG